MNEPGCIVQETHEFNVIFIHSALDDAGLTPQQFRVFAHLARRANMKGKAWPGVDSMASVCRMHKETVIECIRTLEERALIRVERRPGKPNIYRLTSPSEWRLSEMGNGETSRNGGTLPVGTGERYQSERGNVRKSREGNPEKEIQHPQAPASGGSGAASIKSKSEHFEAFWSAYPKKTGKDAARKAWERRNCDEIALEISLSLEAHKESRAWIKDGGRYVPNPATWINQGRWQDDVKPNAAARSVEAYDDEKFF